MPKPHRTASSIPPCARGSPGFKSCFPRAEKARRCAPCRPSSRSAREAVAYLDRALFAHPAPVFTGRPEGVYLSDGLSPYEEAALMTREVRWLLAQGVDPERVAVLYPDAGGYAFAVTAALEDSGIPFYTDQQLPAASHGLAQFWLASLRAMAGGWRNRDMLCLLKSGYAPLTFEEACELENYAYCYGVDRARWTRPFTRGRRPRAWRRCASG